MILVCGSPLDAVTTLTCARLDEAGYCYRLLDLDHYPADYALNWRWQGQQPSGYLRCAAWSLELDAITSAYLRQSRWFGQAHPMQEQSPHAATLYAEAYTALITMLEQLPCLVVNREAPGLSNGSKPYQALVIRECGLLTPPTLVTNDAQAAQDFHAAHAGKLICKSVSGIRSIVRQVDAAQLARLPLLARSPTQFQALLCGDNIRVHVVGDELLATLIHSPAIDYRYAERDGLSVQMEPTTLPPAIAAACLRLTWRLGMALAGLDLMLTPAGEYYCFEVNPMPAYSYFEQMSGQLISLALANLLQRGAFRNEEVAYVIHP